MGTVEMMSSYKIYENLHENDFSERQAKAITECLENLDRNIKNTPNDYATKTDLSVSHNELKSDIENVRKSLKSDLDNTSKTLEQSFKFLDQKIDILRSEMNSAINRLTHWMIGSFTLVFAVLGYLIFK